MWPLWQLQWGLNWWLCDLAGKASGEQCGAGPELENQRHAKEVRVLGTGLSGPNPPTPTGGVRKECTFRSIISLSCKELSQKPVEFSWYRVTSEASVISWMAEEGTGFGWYDAKFHAIQPLAKQQSAQALNSAQLRPRHPCWGVIQSWLRRRGLACGCAVRCLGESGKPF